MIEDTPSLTRDASVNLSGKSREILGSRPKNARQSPATFRAEDIRKHLDKFVIGQVAAKENLSLILSMHQAWEPKVNLLHAPPNGLIIGPTGSGKTFSIQVASKLLKTPFLTIDSTTIVPAGARSGSSVDILQERLEEAVASGAKQAGVKKPIIFLDEFDKLATRESDHNAFWKSDIQRALLKFIEGQSVIEDSATTRGSLIFAGGAFVGIDGAENIRKRRPEISALLRRAPKGTIVADDVKNFGFLPELVARLPAIIKYEQLSEDALLEILRHPRTSPLLVWQQHFGKMGKKIVFTEDFLIAVAKRASTLDMGARSLQQVVFPILARHAYSFEASKLDTMTITLDYLEYGDKHE